MKVALISTNDGFFGPVEKALIERGHEIGKYRAQIEFANGFQVGTLMQWADLVFVDFCQDPLDRVLAHANRTDLAIVARMHRLEIYSALVESDKVPWDRVDTLFVSAEHVLDRFMEKRAGKSKPAEIVLAPTNTVDERFKFVERTWKPPFRICLAGNFVPKKRQYTLIQMMHDVRKEYGDDFHLDIVGARGMWSGYGNVEYFQNCQDLIQDLGLEANVSIFDKISHEQMPGFFGREHIIVSNSNEEGTHVSIAEAAATGCFAFVNAWRGAQKVYPEPAAWSFRSPGEFMDCLRRFLVCVELGKAGEQSEGHSKWVHTTLGDPERYSRMVTVMEETVKRRKAFAAQPPVAVVQGVAP